MVGVSQAKQTPLEIRAGRIQCEDVSYESEVLRMGDQLVLLAGYEQTTGFVGRDIP